jgi:hypothetical protein
MGINYEYSNNKFDFKELYLDCRVTQCYAQDCSKIIAEKSRGL